MAPSVARLCLLLSKDPGGCRERSFELPHRVEDMLRTPHSAPVICEATARVLIVQTVKRSYWLSFPSWRLRSPRARCKTSKSTSRNRSATSSLRCAAGDRPAVAAKGGSDVFASFVHPQDTSTQINRLQTELNRLTYKSEVVSKKMAAADIER